MVAACINAQWGGQIVGPAAQFVGTSCRSKVRLHAEMEVRPVSALVALSVLRYTCLVFVRGSSLSVLSYSILGTVVTYVNLPEPLPLSDYGKPSWRSAPSVRYELTLGKIVWSFLSVSRSFFVSE